MNSVRYFCTFALFLAPALLPAQSPLPVSIHPPVVLMNGWQIQSLSGPCEPRPSATTFGQMQALLEAEGRSVLFFDSCRECADLTIEACAGRFAGFLDQQRDVLGQRPAAFDLVTHSMGGLIARAYLAGYRPEGWFPPTDHRVRKLVLIAVPNFGAYTVANLDPQTRQMQEGSAFLWELATWNQLADDLRGADAIAIAGRAHNGIGDGVLSLISASLAFAAGPERTRVLDYCHTTGFGLAFFCGRAPGLAGVDGPAHDAWRIVRSFLSDTSEWRSIGDSAAEDPWLRRLGGGIAQLLSAHDEPISLRPAQTNALPAGDVAFLFDTHAGPQSFVTAIESGGIRPRLFKYGPVVGRVLTNNMGPGLTIESGDVITLLGNSLAGARLYANLEPLEVIEGGNERVVAILPDKFTGLVWLTLETDEGTHTVRIMARAAARPVRMQSGMPMPE